MRVGVVQESQADMFRLARGACCTFLSLSQNKTGERGLDYLLRTPSCVCTPMICSHVSVTLSSCTTCASRHAENFFVNHGDSATSMREIKCHRNTDLRLYDTAEQFGQVHRHKTRQQQTIYSLYFPLSLPARSSASSPTWPARGRLQQHLDMALFLSTLSRGLVFKSVDRRNLEQS